MTETLIVDPARLASASTALTAAAAEIPMMPPPLVVSGADALSQAVSVGSKAIELPMAALPQIQADATKTAASVGAAGQMYASQDEALATKVASHQFVNQGAPGLGAGDAAAQAGGAGAAGAGGSAGAAASAGGSGGGGAAGSAASAASSVGGAAGKADGLSQMMGMPMQMAQQAGQVPQQIAQAAGSAPQGVMQAAQGAVQQVTQMAGQMGKSTGEDKAEGLPQELVSDRARTEGPAEENGGVTVEGADPSAHSVA